MKRADSRRVEGDLVISGPEVVTAVAELLTIPLIRMHANLRRVVDQPWEAKCTIVYPKPISLYKPSVSNVLPDNVLPDLAES